MKAIGFIPAMLSLALTTCAFADGSMNTVLNNGLVAPPAVTEPPATVFTAKRIITMERSNPEATAVAVFGKRIIAAGSLDEVKTALGRQPFKVDQTFADQVILPGFIDQHLHPVLGGLTLATEVIAPENWVLPGRTYKAANSAKEYSMRLKEAVGRMTNPDEWFFSWGYHTLWHGKLNRTMLDAISATRPIVIWQRSCHEFILNTPALKGLGLTEAGLQNQGTASKMADWQEGHFWESGLNLMIMPMMKHLATPERLSFGLKQMVEYLHQNGVTAYNEPGALYTPDMWNLYEQILGADSTPMYTTFLADGRGIPDRVGLDKALAATEEQIAVSPEGPGKKVMFFSKQIKLFADGAIISQLMQMKDGYLGPDGKVDPNHHGEWLLTPEQLEARSKLYWDAGYQIHTHVNGDLGLEVLLDTLERRMHDNPRADHRSVIVHFASSTEEQIARIARLGALVSANPYYPVGFADKYGEVGLGPERADKMVRAASVLKHHIPLSYHSDLPMAPSDPLYLAWCGVNRLTPSGRVAGPEQRIGVEDALRAVTIEAAYSWRKENDLGSIAPGKIANFTILGQDPFVVEAAKLKDIPVLATVFEGRVFPVKHPKTTGRAKVSVPKEQLPEIAGGHDGHAHGDCGACSFNRLLATVGWKYTGRN